MWFVLSPCTLQTPQTEAKDAEVVDRTPNNSRQSTEEGVCETDGPRSLDSHVTAGETSSVKATEGDACNDQSRLCASSLDTAFSSGTCCLLRRGLFERTSR